MVGGSGRVAEVPKSAGGPSLMPVGRSGHGDRLLLLRRQGQRRMQEHAVREALLQSLIQSQRPRGRTLTEYSPIRMKAIRLRGFGEQEKRKQ